MDNSWMTDGNCATQPPEFFFPSDGVGVEAAKKVCADCPVKEPCLEYAIRNRIDHGVWGGASERQRRRLIKERRARKRVKQPSPERATTPPAEAEIPRR
jgi:WhiB family redox-sensing transcriptional regulator